MKKILLLPALALLLFACSGGEDSPQDNNTNGEQTETPEQPSDFQEEEEENGDEEVSDASGWETYNSETLQLSFSYPPNYILDTENENNQMLQLREESVQEAIEAEEWQEGAPLILIELHQKEPNTALLDWVKTESQNAELLKAYTEDQFEEQQINGTDTLVYRIDLAYGPADKVVMASDDGTLIYEFSALYGGEQSFMEENFPEATEVAMKEDFEAILETVELK